MLSASVYAALAILSFLCAIAQSRAMPLDQELMPWRFCALLLGLLAIISFSEADIALLAWLREQARRAGWYEQRRNFQLLAIFCSTIGMGFAVFCLSSRYSLQAITLLQKSCLLAVFTLAALTLVRLISYHYSDQFLDMSVLGLTISQQLKLLATGLIGFATFRELLNSFVHLKAGVSNV